MKKLAVEAYHAAVHVEKNAYWVIFAASAFVMHNLYSWHK